MPGDTSSDPPLVQKKKSPASRSVRIKPPIQIIDRNRMPCFFNSCPRPHAASPVVRFCLTSDPSNNQNNSIESVAAAPEVREPDGG
jgi:hypothetical protein